MCILRKLIIKKIKMNQNMFRRITLFKFYWSHFLMFPIGYNRVHYTNKNNNARNIVAQSTTESATLNSQPLNNVETSNTTLTTVQNTDLQFDFRHLGDTFAGHTKQYCKYCIKSFAKYGNYTKHLQNKHGQLYKCDLCAETFYHLDHWKKHW